MSLIRIICAMSLLLAVIAVASVPAAAAERPGPGAFLKYRVDSVSALVAQLDKEPRVAERYAAHFGVSRQYLKDYIGKHVKLITLRKATSATVYFTAKGGGVARERRILPAGTRVFATGQGDLVMEWRCGNPLASRLPAVTSKAAAPTLPTTAGPTDTGTAIAQSQPTPTTPTVAPTAPPAVEPPAVVAANTVETPEAPPVVGVLPSVETLAPPPPITAPVVPAAVPPAIATTTAPAVTAPAVLSSGGGGFPWVLPLLLGAGAGLAGGGGGGGGSPEPTPIPEPMTIVLLSTGIAAYGLRLKTRKR